MGGAQLVPLHPVQVEDWSSQYLIGLHCQRQMQPP